MKKILLAIFSCAALLGQDSVSITVTVTETPLVAASVSRASGELVAQCLDGSVMKDMVFPLTDNRVFALGLGDSGQQGVGFSCTLMRSDAAGQAYTSGEVDVECALDGAFCLPRHTCPADGQPCTEVVSTAEVMDGPTDLTPYVEEEFLRAWKLPIDWVLNWVPTGPQAGAIHSGSAALELERDTAAWK